MTDLLSQAEIDALLKDAGGGGGGEPPAPPSGGGEPPAPPPGGGGGGGDDGGDDEADLANRLTPEELKQLTEVANLSLGANSSVVQMLVNRPVEIAPSQLRIVSYKGLSRELASTPCLIARIGYTEGFDGNSYLLLTKSLAALIGDLMMGGEGQNPEFQEMHMSAAGELLNQMMGKTTTTLSEIFKKRVDIAPPQVELVDFAKGPPNMSEWHESAVFLRMGFNLKIGDLAEAEMIQILAIDFAKLMAGELVKPPEPPKKAKPAPPPPGPLPTAGPAAPMPGADPNAGQPGMMPGMMQGQ